MNPSERLYALDKSRPVSEAVVANLATAYREALPYALGRVRNSKKGTYVIVGAGPSLTHTGPFLGALREKGAMICTVNTALKKVSQYLEPDVVLAREIVDVSEHVKYPTRLRVLDVGSNPKVFHSSMEMPGVTSWFFPAQLAYFEAASILGVRSLLGGGAALTALIALVLEWGAASILLLGVDLAISDSGEGYAPGTAFGDYHVSSTGEVSGEGLKVKMEAHASGGVLPPTRQMGLRSVPAWGGKGTAQAMQVYWDQLEWLEDFAKVRRSAGTLLYDVTGAGAQKPGWIERHIEDVTQPTNPLWLEYDQAPPPPLGHIPIERWDALRADLERQVQGVRDISANILHPEGFPMGVPDLLKGTDLVDLAAARALLLGFESKRSVPDKIQHAYGSAYPDAALAIHKQLTSWVTKTA